MSQTGILVQPTVLGLTPTFGFGDRTGLATPGHLAALQEARGPIHGLFAQQSIRELTRTQRQPEDVISAARNSLSAAGYSNPWGADADHLKTTDDVLRTVSAGFVFFTIDPSAVVDQHADNDDEATLREKFETVRDVVDWGDEYRGKTVHVDANLKIEFDALSVLRAAIKYGRAISQTVEMVNAIKAAANARHQPWEIELSVDETSHPTSLVEHYIIADQLRRRDVNVISLAPRFVGELEKGIDYKGDVSALEQSLRDHAAIARELGPYKLSLHSGSDKLSIYRLLAQATQGRFHVKTAGTSYLEALRVVARCAPDEFRRIVQFSRSRYDEDKATYHVSATLETVPGIDEIQDAQEMERVYLDCWDHVPQGCGFTAKGRQMLHCTFGSVLTHPEFGALIPQVLSEHGDVYKEVLREHFVRHLHALNS